MKKASLYIITVITGVYALACELGYVVQEKFIFFPEKLPADYEFKFKEPFEELFFKVDKDAAVSALLFKAVHPKGLVLYFHGSAGSLASWGNVAGDFTSLGYDVLLSDYRGYGKSTGSISEKALLDDAQYVYDEMKKRYAEDSNKRGEFCEAR